MNPDQYPIINQNQYYPLQNDSQRVNQLPKDEKTQSQDNLVQKLPQNYANYGTNLYKPIQPNEGYYQPNQPNFNQQSSNNPNYQPNIPKKSPEPAFQPQPNHPVYKHQGQVIIYNQVDRTQADLKNYKPNQKLKVIIDGPNNKDSILYGQSVPCQRCGLVYNGNLNLRNGRTVCAWASCLFLTTGLFCFLPCVIDKCKDTEIKCVRCGHKKAVVKSQMCC